MNENERREFNDNLNVLFEEFKKRNDTAIEEMQTRGGDATAETTAIVDQINTDITDLRTQIKDLEVRSNRPTHAPDGTPELSPEVQMHHRAFDKMLRGGLEDGSREEYVLDVDEKRALTSASDGTGGFLVPVDYEGGIIMDAYDAAEVRPLCQVGTTSRDTVQMGALSKPSVAWGPKAALTVSAQTLTAGSRTITIYPLSALTLVAVDTLDDAEANLETEINGAFGRATGEAEDDAFVVGAGDDSPRGVVAHTGGQGRYKASGVAAALSDANNNGMDALTAVFYGLKKTYRRNSTWAFNSNTEAAIRKLKDGEGRYLWEPNTQIGKPVTLLSRPLVNPEGMPDIGAGTYPIVLGDFLSGYKIRDRKGMTIQRLVERYAEYFQVGFIVRKRVGGDVVLAEAFTPMKIAAS